MAKPGQRTAGARARQAVHAVSVLAVLAVVRQRREELAGGSPRTVAVACRRGGACAAPGLSGQNLKPTLAPQVRGARRCPSATRAASAVSSGPTAIVTSIYPDMIGRVVKRIDPNIGTRTFTYLPSGLVEKMRFD